MKIIEGGVTAAQGFEAAGIEAAIKYQNRKDMAMVYSRTPCRAAGVFTSNVVKAAPVLWDKEIVENAPSVQAVIVNSGIANACTGRQGYDCCRQTAEKTAQLMGFHRMRCWWLNRCDRESDSGGEAAFRSGEAGGSQSCYERSGYAGGGSHHDYGYGIQAGGGAG